MKNSTLATAVIAAMAIAPASAFAARNISYTYLEGNYILQNVDMYEDNDALDDFIEDVDDGDGFGVEGSIAITDYMFLFAGYSQTEADFDFIDDTGYGVVEGQDVKSVSLGAGYFKEINRKTDFVARLAYMDVDLGDFNFGQSGNDVIDGGDDLETAFDDLDEDSSDGYFVDLGVRAQSFEWLELGGGVRYTDLDTGDDFSLFGNALMEINQNMGLNLAVDLGDDLSTYRAGFRFSF